MSAFTTCLQRSRLHKSLWIYKSVAVRRHENETSRQLSMSWELLPALCCSNRNLSRSVQRSLLLSVDISQVNSHSKRGRSGETARQRLQHHISTLPVLNSESRRTMRTEMMDEMSGFMSEALPGKANLCYSTTKRVLARESELRRQCPKTTLRWKWCGGVMKPAVPGLERCLRAPRPGGERRFVTAACKGQHPATQEGRAFAASWWSLVLALLLFVLSRQCAWESQSGMRTGLHFAL